MILEKEIIYAGIALRKLFLSSTLLMVISNQSHPQDKQFIKYEGIISSETVMGKTGLIKKLGNLITGKDRTEIKNPVAVYAESPESIWILSQGNGSVIYKGRSGLENLSTRFKNNTVMPSLVSLCALENNTLLFTDSYNNRIYKLSTDDKDISIFGQGLDLGRPTGIACSPVSNEIWVVETTGHCISVLDKKGRLVKKVGKRGAGDGEFNFPSHIWVDRQGLMYIVDAMNFRVQVFNGKGEFISSFGKAGDSSGYMARPKGVATDSFGNIYVVDALFHAVQIFDRQGKFLYSFGSQGHGEGQFWMPNGIYIDKNNYIYVSDNFNNRIQIFSLVN